MKWPQHELEQHMDPVELRRLFAAWFGVLGGPLAWAMQLQLVYLQAELACLGLAPEIGLHVTSGAALLLAMSSLWVAWHHYAKRGHRWPSDEAYGMEATRRFLGALGMLSGSLFTVVITALWIAAATLDVCPKYQS